MGEYSYLTFDQRREIESLYNDGNRVVDIASKIQRSVAAVYEDSNAGTQGNLMKINVLNTTLILRKQQYKRIYGEEATSR